MGTPFSDVSTATTGFGSASMTVHGICCPSSLKIWVMPSLRPMIPMLMASLHLDFDVDAGRQIQLRQRVHRLRARIMDVDHAFVRLELELLARLLVDVRRPQHGPPLRLRRQRNRTGHLRARLLRRAHDVRRGLVDHRVVERLETDSNSSSHGSMSWEPGAGSRKAGAFRSRLPATGSRLVYARIFVTTPAPTVRPPSRMA